jgi:predicted nucleic acid-binding protein
MMSFMAHLFVDTWGWLTLRNKKERRHADMVPVFESFQKPEHRVFTSDFVLDETFTLLFRRLPFGAAREGMELLAASVDEGSLVCIPSTARASGRRRDFVFVIKTSLPSHLPT